MLIIKLIIFSYANYLLTEYFKEKETAYLFLGSLSIALFYILMPEFILLIPYYSLIFFFALDKKEKGKRTAQLLTFLMPTAAAAFSLSYISWIYGYGFRLVYLSGSLFNTSIEGIFNLNLGFALENLLRNMPLMSLIYIFIFIWLIIKKSLSKVYIYLYLSPLLLLLSYAFIYNLSPGIYFYVPTLIFPFLFFMIFFREFSTAAKRSYYFIFIINFLLLSLYLLAVISILPYPNFDFLDYLSSHLDPLLIHFKTYTAQNWPGPNINLIRKLYYK